MRILLDDLYRGRFVAWVVGCLLFAATPGRALDFSIESAGVRYGFPADSGSGTFHQTEAYTDWSLPPLLDLGPNWHLEPRFDIAAGVLGQDGRDAFIGSAGPLLALGYKHFPVWLEGGSNLTGITRVQYGVPRAPGSKDFGEPIQFTSRGGLYWDVTAHVRVGYTFQHMSNAHISSTNPGLNLHVFALSYRF
jgi:hypothetical protein